MSSNIVILQLAVLLVVLESDLGRRRVGWFRVTRPIVAVAVIVPIFFTSVPTGGNDLLLQAAGILAGIGLGCLSMSPLFVRVGYDPAFRAHRWWWPGRRAPRAGAVTRAGVGYAAVWIVVSALRLVFAYGATNWFPTELGQWLAHNHLDSTALGNSLIFLAIGMDVFRSVVLAGRGAVARRHHRRTHPAAPDAATTGRPSAVRAGQ